MITYYGPAIMPDTGNTGVKQILTQQQQQQQETTLLIATMSKTQGEQKYLLLPLITS